MIPPLRYDRPVIFTSESLLFPSSQVSSTTGHIDQKHCSGLQTYLTNNRANKANRLSGRVTQVPDYQSRGGIRDIDACLYKDCSSV